MPGPGPNGPSLSTSSAAVPRSADGCAWSRANHDVNIIDRANPGRLDLPLSIGQSLRKLRVVLALDALSGDRLHVVERGTGRLGPSLKDFLRLGRRADVLRGLAHRGTLRGRREITRVWEAMFPL